MSAPTGSIAPIVDHVGLHELLDADVWRYGPEPEGPVVKIGSPALDELPLGWGGRVDRR